MSTLSTIEALQQQIAVFGFQLAQWSEWQGRIVGVAGTIAGVAGAVVGLLMALGAERRAVK